MERKQKTYQATQAIQLDTYVEVKGGKRLIEFRGGTLNPRRNGLFSTSTPEIMDALDADIKRVGPGCTFKCIHEEILLDDDAPVKSNKIHLGGLDVPGVKTVTAARTWLVDASFEKKIEEGITSSMIKNRTDVLRIAEEHGIVFTELPVE